MLDFLISHNNAGGQAEIVERNIYRYKPFTDNAGKKSLLLFGLSIRSYGDDITSFLGSLKSNRADLINIMSHYKIPAINISCLFFI